MSRPGRRRGRHRRTCCFRAAEAQQMTAVTQLGWLRIGEYAPILVAEAKGSSRTRGLTTRRSMAARQEPDPIAAVGRRSSASPPRACDRLGARRGSGRSWRSACLPAPSSCQHHRADAPPKPKDMEERRRRLRRNFKAFEEEQHQPSKVKATSAHRRAADGRQIDFFRGDQSDVQDRAGRQNPDALATVRQDFGGRFAEWGVPLTDVIFTSATRQEVIRNWCGATSRLCSAACSCDRSS